MIVTSRSRAYKPADKCSARHMPARQNTVELRHVSSPTYVCWDGASVDDSGGRIKPTTQHRSRLAPLLLPGVIGY